MSLISIFDSEKILSTVLVHNLLFLWATVYHVLYLYTICVYKNMQFMYLFCTSCTVNMPCVIAPLQGVTDVFPCGFPLHRKAYHVWYGISLFPHFSLHHTHTHTVAHAIRPFPIFVNYSPSPCLPLLYARTHTHTFRLLVMM